MRPSNLNSLRSASVNGVLPANNRFLRRPDSLRLPPRRIASLSVQSHSDVSLLSSEQSYTSAVGAPSLQFSQRNLTDRHVFCLYVIASAVAVSASWLFFSAIPALLAFKRAAESLEKLMDVTREELPDTMAAVRLSGMEISDLTMELSDLGQEITQGVRNSTKVVRVAEEGLRRLTDINPSAMMQEEARSRNEASRQVIAQTARNMKDGIVKGRSILQMFFSMTRFSSVVFNYFTKQSKQ